VLPLLGGLLGGVFGSLALLLDQHVDVPPYFQYSPSTASTVLSSIVASAAALTGFVVTVTVLVVQWRPARSRRATCGSGTGIRSRRLDARFDELAARLDRARRCSAS
jgi:hypothetical protein